MSNDLNSRMICSICWTPKLDRALNVNKICSDVVKNIPEKDDKEVNLSLNSSDEEIYNLYGFKGFETSESSVDDTLIKGDNTYEEKFSSDSENESIKQGDNLLLTLNIEGNTGFVDIFAYNEDINAFYPHHDIILAKKPLCLDHILKSGSDNTVNEICAVGYNNSSIELWNLAEPFATKPLSLLNSSKKRKKRKSLECDVIDLQWNRNDRNLLGSCYSDCTVKLWDIYSESVSHTFVGQKSNFLTFQWQKSSNKFLTVDDSKFLYIFDSRNKNESTEINIGVLNKSKPDTKFYRFDLALWHPTDDNKIITFGRMGKINLLDIRMNDKYCWTHKVSRGSILGADASAYNNGTVACICKKGYVVLTMLDEACKNFEVFETNIEEKCYEIKFCPDKPSLAAYGIKPGKVNLVDFAENTHYSCLSD